MSAAIPFPDAHSAGTSSESPLTAEIIMFQPRACLRLLHSIELICTRDELRDHPDGSWSSRPKPPPGYSWEIDRMGDRHTVWRRIT
jgi:hypothetical protein